MKILFVITRADTIAGAQVHVMEMAEAVRQAGHESHVVVGPGAPYLEALQAKGISCTPLDSLIRSISPVRDMAALRDIKGVIQTVQPDVISTHSSKAGILGRIAAWWCRVPCLFTAHGWSFTEGVPQPRRSLYRLIEKAVAPLAARIICVSEADRQFAIAAGINEKRLLTIHNGRHDLPEPESRPQPDPSAVRLVMIGRLDEQKDHALLLRALAGLEGFTLELIGDGPRLAALQQLAEELGIGQAVQFSGLCRDVPARLARADVFCLITNWEGFPRSTLEAMRAGLPVVVSDAGGSGEAVAEGQTGYVVPRGDCDRLREKIKLLIEDQNLRTRMGRAGRKRFLEHFTFEQMCRKTMDVYKDVLQPGGHGA